MISQNWHLIIISWCAWRSMILYRLYRYSRIDHSSTLRALVNLRVTGAVKSVKTCQGLLSWGCDRPSKTYPLVNIQKAIENGHRNSGVSHEKMVIFHRYVTVYQRVTLTWCELWFDFISPRKSIPKYPNMFCCWWYLVLTQDPLIVAVVDVPRNWNWTKLEQ